MSQEPKGASTPSLAREKFGTAPLTKKLVEREGLQALLKMNAYYSDQVPELASPKQSLGFSP